MSLTWVSIATSWLKTAFGLLTVGQFVAAPIAGGSTTNDPSVVRLRETVSCTPSMPTGPGERKTRASNVARAHIDVAWIPQGEVRTAPPGPAPCRLPGEGPINEPTPKRDFDSDASDPTVEAHHRRLFDSNAFGYLETLDRLRERLDAQLELRIKQVDQKRRLLPSELKKLRLAGKGDIQRLCQQIEGERIRFDALRNDEVERRIFLVKLRWRNLAGDPGPWDHGSLFDKVLHKIDEDRKVAGDAPLPGSGVELADAVDRAEIIATAREIRPLTRSSVQDLSLWCARVEIGRSLKGDIPEGELLLKAVPVASWESLPASAGGEEYLLFFQPAAGTMTGRQQLFKMLRATERNRQSIRALLRRFP